MTMAAYKTNDVALSGGGWGDPSRNGFRNWPEKVKVLSNFCNLDRLPFETMKSITIDSTNIPGAKHIDPRRSRWYRTRTVAYWTATFVVVSELVAGSVWNLEQIEWIRVQLNHLGYPLYFSWISGLWQVGGA